MPVPPDLARRVDRIESLDAIRQLASKYSLAIDVRDLDALVALYVPQVKVGRGAQGRGALRDVFERVLRGFTTSSHQVQNHVIEFDDADHAQGLVTCRCEHEVATAAGPQWVIDRQSRLHRSDARRGNLRPVSDAPVPH